MPGKVIPMLVTSSLAVWQYVKTISSIWIRSTQEIKTSDANTEQFIHYVGTRVKLGDQT